jgi:putative phosphoesterase
VFGDAHIPTRRDSIPEEFYKHIESSHYDLAMITGDMVREHDMRAAMPPLPRSFIVRGNMDYSRDYNFSEQIQLDEIKFLLMHGTQLSPRGNINDFLKILHETEADVGVHGHTHEAAVDLVEGKLFLNPGTISGATGGYSGLAPASFMELDVRGSSIDLTLHSTDWQVVKKTEACFRKEEGTIVRC